MFYKIASIPVIVSLIIPVWMVDVAPVQASGGTPVYTCTIDTVQSVSDCMAPVSVLHNQSGQSVIKLSFDDWNDQSIIRADIRADVSDDAHGWLIDISDSDTGNGYGTDWETQSNDAELQFTAQQRAGSTEFSWALFGNDAVPQSLTRDQYRLLESRSRIPYSAIASAPVQFSIANHLAEITFPHGRYGTDTSSPYLFALADQPDYQGSVNRDVYVGVNRVVDGDYRAGYGVSRVTVTLYAGNTPDVSRLSLWRSMRNYQRNASRAQPMLAFTSPSVLELMDIQQALQSQGVALNNRLGTGFLYTNPERSSVMIAEVLRATGVNPDIGTTGRYKSLRRFQRANKLQPNGIWNPETISRLLYIDQSGQI